MDIFKIFGSIAINNDEANNALDETAKKAESTASTLGSKFESIGSSMEKVGKTLAPVSLAVGGALTASVMGASNFTDGMAKMSTLIDTSTVSLEDLSSQFLVLSDNVGMSASDLAEAGYQALSAGVDVENAVGFVQSAGLLARAGFTSTANAVDILTTAINAFGLEQSEAESIADKLVTTQNLGKTTVDELASSMGKIIPTANAYGVSIDSILAGYATMTKNGIATAETTTYMNSMLNELGKDGTTASTALREMTEHIQEGGMSFREMMDAGWDLQDVLSLLDEKAYESGLSMMDMFGSAEAGKSASLLWDKGAEFVEIEGQMETSAGAVSEAIDKLNTPSQMARESLNRLKNSGISLGESILTALAPTIDKVVGAIERLTTWFNNLDDGTKQTIAGVMGFIAVLSPVLTIGGKIVSGIGTVISSVSKLTPALSAVSAPVLVIIAVVGALIGIFATLWESNEDFRIQMTSIWNYLKSVIVEFVEGVQERFEPLKEAFLNFIETVRPYWEEFCNLFAPIFEGAFAIVVTVFEFVCDTILSLMEVFTFAFNGDWEGAWNAVLDIFSNLWDALVSVFETILATLEGVVNVFLSWFGTNWSSVWNSVKTFFVNTWNSIKSAVTNTINTIKSTVSNVFNSIKSTVTSIWNGIKTAITTPIESAKEKVKSIIDAIKGFFNFEWSLPSLKLPHFTAEGSFSLNPLSVPHFAISWYKKAMNEPVMFTEPTIFSTSSGLKGAGEAGDEVMIGKDTMLQMMQDAVSAEMLILDDHLSKIFDLLKDYIPNIANRQLVLDTGAIVGGLAPSMDQALGNVYRRRERGV